MSLDTEDNNLWTRKYGSIGRSCFRKCSAEHYIHLVPSPHELAMYYSCMDKCVKDELEKNTLKSHLLGSAPSESLLLQTRGRTVIKKLKIIVYPNNL